MVFAQSEVVDSYRKSLTQLQDIANNADSLESLKDNLTEFAVTCDNRINQILKNSNSYVVGSLLVFVFLF